MQLLARPALPQPARVIVLNGTSSAGKTSLAKAMQAMWAVPLHHIQLDAFRDMEPPGYWDGWETQEKEAIDLKTAALCGAMHSAVNAYSKHGQEVVFDTAITNPYARQLFAEDLSDLPVYLVAVHCSAEQLDLREKARGDRPVGRAASQVNWIHKRMQYDFEVDTTHTTPQESANAIVLWLASGPKPLALNRLRVQLNAAS